MTEIKETRLSEVLKNTNDGRPHFHIGSCGAKCDAAFIGYSRDSSSCPVIELRSGSLITLTKQPPEVLGEMRQEDGARVVCSNCRRVSWELSIGQNTCCSVECTTRVKTRNERTSADDSCCCMYKSSGRNGNIKRRTSYVKNDDFCAIIHPLDSTLLMPPPFPLELDDGSWSSPMNNISTFYRGTEH
jgi:hypothetical protein